jgi:GINS complex subunit 2
VLELERQDPSSFQPLPFHYQEVAHCLFTAGTQESLPREVFGDEQGRVRDLVNLVQKTRYNKILQGLGMMQEAAAVKLNNLAAMELNAVRAFFTGALDQFHRYSRIGEADEAGAGAPLAEAPPAEEAQQPARQLRRVR